MTQLRIKLLAATFTAVAATGAASAQVLRVGGQNGVVIAPAGAAQQGVYGQPAYGQPAYGYNNTQPGLYYGNAQNAPFRGTNTMNGVPQPYVLTQPGSNYFPAQNPTYQTPNQAYYTTPNGTVVQQSGVVQQGMVQQSGYVTDANGVVRSGGVVYQSPANGVVQTGAMMMPQSDKVVSTQVFAPDGATVTLSGVQADRTQGARPFVSPPLEDGKTYTYRAKATWVDDNGKTMTRQKAVDVKAGQNVTIDLTKSDTDVKTGSNDE